MPLYYTDRRRARRVKHLPQFELPQAEAVFNLASETATLGISHSCDACGEPLTENDETLCTKCKQRQQEQQPSLF